MRDVSVMKEVMEDVATCLRVYECGVVIHSYRFTMKLLVCWCGAGEGNFP